MHITILYLTDVGNDIHLHVCKRINSFVGYLVPFSKSNNLIYKLVINDTYTNDVRKNTHTKYKWILGVRVVSKQPAAPSDGAPIKPHKAQNIFRLYPFGAPTNAKLFLIFP